MNAVPSLRAQFTIRELDAARLVNVPARALCEAAGIDLAEVDDPLGVVSLQKISDVYALAAEKAGDDALGLHVGERSGPGMIDVFDYALMSRPTLSKAFADLTPHLRAFYPEAEIGLFARSGAGVFSYRMDAHEAQCQRHRCEAFVAGVLRIAQRALARDEGPIAVAFQHGAPTDVSEHARVFGAAVQFDAPATELVFSRAWLDAPLATADADLSTVIDRQLSDLLARMPSGRQFACEVRALLRREFSSGTTTLPLLAKRVGVSERTLQRRLHEEGTSLQDIAEDVRQELSLTYLRNPGLSMGEIADRLGYASLAAFSRAFRRWRGVSPAAHRNRGRAAFGSA